MSWVAISVAVITAGGQVGAAALSDGGGGGGGGGFDISELMGIINQFKILSPEQQDKIVQDLLTFQDLPGSPLGKSARSLLGERLSPDFTPGFFKEDVRNPFFESLRRPIQETRDQSLEQLESQLQRQGAFFSPDLTKLTQRLFKDFGQQETDIIAPFVFRGAEVGEGLKTDALARVFGLEKQTASVLDQLLGRNLQGAQIGSNFVQSLFGGGGGIGGFDPAAFAALGGGAAVAGGAGGGGGFEEFFAQFLQQQAQEAGIFPE